jgi:hypothetical protein
MVPRQAKVFIQTSLNVGWIKLYPKPNLSNADDETTMNDETTTDDDYDATTTIPESTSRA